MNKGKKILIGFLVGFIITEIIFCVLVLLYGNGDIQGVILKTVFSLVLFYFYFKGFKWAKWIFSIGVIFEGLLMILAGLDQENSIFYMLSIFYIAFGIAILFSKSINNYFVESNKTADNVSIDFDTNKIYRYETDEISKDFVKKSINKYQTKDYPQILDRIKANLIDSLVIVSLMYIISFLLNEMNINNATVKGILFFLIISYEPIMTSKSKTFGQKLIGIKVRKNTIKGENISILSSYVRYVAKILLGVFSLFAISLNEQKRAIHDILINSVMTKK